MHDLQFIQLSFTVCSVPSPRGGFGEPSSPNKSSKPPKLKHETL